MTAIQLPDGLYTLREPVTWASRTGFTSRIAYAAAHVVGTGSPAVIDWDATLAYRRHLWSYGFRVADAMDTAQRNMGLDWAATQALIRRSAAEAPSPEHIACGAGTDHLSSCTSLDQVVAAYEEQIELVQDAGASVIVMASRQLTAIARGPEDYLNVYGRLLSQVDRPVILHWLGPMFDPQLAGYWGSSDVPTATKTFLDLIWANAAKVDGVKVSLLDEDHEVRLRAELPEGVKLYTGDDFNYPSLIKSGSHALLGIFDAIAPAASAALAALDDGNMPLYDAIFGPTVALSRKIFEAPTYNYKTGIVFLAWLAGHQPSFTMVNGAESARSLDHLIDVFKLADQAGLLPDPALAAARLTTLL